MTRFYRIHGHRLTVTGTLIEDDRMCRVCGTPEEHHDEEASHPFECEVCNLGFGVVFMTFLTEFYVREAAA